MDVPDAETIQNQFMDKLTSNIESFFTVENQSESPRTAAGEGADASSENTTMINTTLDSSVDQESNKTINEGDQVAEKSI